MKNSGKPSFIEQPIMKDDMQLPGSDQAPVKTFEGHEKEINCIVTFPDGKRIVTGSFDKTIRIWRLEDGTEMKKWAVKKIVSALLILQNGKHVVSAEGEGPDLDDDLDDGKEYPWLLCVRDAETGKIVAGPLDGHTHGVIDLDISPDGGILASGSLDCIVILWDTDTWQKKGKPIWCDEQVNCVRFSPTGQLGVATDHNIQIWDVARRECLTQFNGHSDFNNAINFSLTWTHNGAHLLSAGTHKDSVIRCWDASTWKQAGDPWIGHDAHIYHITLNPAGTLLLSASRDHTVRLWQLPTCTEVAHFQHSDAVVSVAFSVDGRSIFSGGFDEKISQWEIPEQVLAAVRSDSFCEKNEAGPSWRKKRNTKRLFDPEIPGQRRNQALSYELTNRPHGRATHSALPRAHAESSLLHDFRTFFDGIQPSSHKKGKQKELQSNRKPLQVIDVPLGTATPGDAVGVDDGTRPYALFFCLSWFRKNEKKPDLPRQRYDDDPDEDEDFLDTPIPTTTTRVQLQPEAGPSRFAVFEEHLQAKSS